MTGATDFTRTAGRLGVLTLPAAFFLGFLAAIGGSALAVLALIAVAVMGLVAFVGLLARHRTHWWVWPVGVLMVLTIPLNWVDGTLGLVVSLAAQAGLLIGVVLAEELPRTGAVIALVALPLETLVPAFGLLLAIGYLMLFWAMWHEGVLEVPLSQQAPARPESALGRELPGRVL